MTAMVFGPLLFEPSRRILMAHHKTEKHKGGKHNESKAGKLKIHGGFKASEHEKKAERKK
jgi:hypothetical protein